MKKLLKIISIILMTAILMSTLITAYPASAFEEISEAFENWWETSGSEEDGYNYSFDYDYDAYEAEVST